MSNTRQDAGLNGAATPEMGWRKVIITVALLVLLLWGAMWWLDRRPRRVRLIIGREGCAAIEGAGLPVERAAEGGGCVVGAVLLPATIYDALAGPPHSMYRLGPPSDSSAGAEVWLKKHLVREVIYEADH